jgi:hypothetical protein
MKDKNIVVTVKGFKFNNELQLTLNWDADLEDWKQAFKTILIHQTFCEDTVKELFENYEEETTNYDFNNANSINDFMYCSQSHKASSEGSMDNSPDNLLYPCEPRR